MNIKFNNIEILELIKDNQRFIESLLAPLDEEELTQPFYRLASGLIKKNIKFIKYIETLNYFESTKNVNKIDKLKKCIKLHLNPYNLGDDGETARLINDLIETHTEMLTEIYHIGG